MVIMIKRVCQKMDTPVFLSVNVEEGLQALYGRGFPTYVTGSASPFRVLAKVCGVMVTGPRMNSGML